MRMWWVVWVLAVLAPGVAWAEAPERGANGERVWLLPMVQLLPFQALSAAMWADAAFDLVGDDQAWVTPLLGGAAWAGTLGYVFRDGLTAGHAHALDSGVVWGTAGAWLVAKSLDSVSDDRSVALLWGVPLGFGLGALYEGLAQPTSGQVATINSFGLAGAVMFVASWDDARAFEPLHAAAWIGGGLAVGGLVSRYKPLSRPFILVAELGAFAAVSLWAMATNPLFSSEDAQELNIGIAYVAALSAMYALLPAERGGEAGGVSIMPAVQQGGLGVAVGGAW